MQIVNFPETGYVHIGASGTCPHCGVQSLLQPIATIFEQAYNKMVSAVRCQNCKGYGVVIGARNSAGNPCWMVAFYPSGQPNDKVDENVPTAIRNDFTEALRCDWIRAYKGCVVLCARAIQASAIALGAKKKKLTDQIDELFALGKITEALKDFAHEIRVTRNLGAHPDKDGLEEVDENDSRDIISFTREYLHHVYVMPALLAARKAASAAATSAGASGAPTTPGKVT